MKFNTTIAAALMACGLISSAHAYSTFGNTNVVYISGSTAFRANLFNTLTNNLSTPTVFDVGATITLWPSTANGSTSTYNIEGLINGTPTLISVALTGSEAGIASLLGSTITYSVPKNPSLGQAAAGSVTLAGTPKATFITPGTSTAGTTAATDLAFADTSVAVSLSAVSASTLTDYGIVGVIPFTWAKGYSSTTDSSYTDLANVTSDQLPVELGSAQAASFFTGVAADTDKVYLVGRNEGSGTRVNMLCDQFAGISLGAVKQYCPSNCSYVSGVLTIGTAGKISTIGITSVGGDGFDAGSGVSGTLKYDSDSLNSGKIMLGYLGISDASSAATGGAVWLKENGVAESDGAVIKGQYTFWGHEHFYGANNVSASGNPAGAVATLLVGSNVNEALSTFSANGAIESKGQMGGATASANSTAIDAALMHCDRPSGADIGFLGQF